MRGMLYSICIGSVALALTAQSQEVQSSPTVNAETKARRPANGHTTTSANTRSAMSTMRSDRSRTNAGENAKNLRARTNVHVDVNDRTRFANVTRITSNGRTFDRAVFRDRDDWHLHLGFHDRIFFINNFSEVILINGCSFFLDEGIFWPAFIIGETCVFPRNVVFIAVD